MSEELRAWEYDVTATVKFKDITYGHGPAISAEDIAIFEASIEEMLREELDFLTFPSSLGGFTIEVRVSDGRDVTDILELTE